MLDIVWMSIDRHTNQGQRSVNRNGTADGRQKLLSVGLKLENASPPFVLTAVEAASHNKLRCSSLSTVDQQWELIQDTVY